MYTFPTLKFLSLFTKLSFVVMPTKVTSHEIFELVTARNLCKWFQKLPSFHTLLLEFHFFFLESEEAES